MRVFLVGAAMMAMMGVGGCNPAIEAGTGAAPDHGRYVGIGIYSTGPLWARMAGAAKPKDAAAATIEDDEKIIVLVDSRTGEIRQCGNLTGYCIGMNPWTKALLASRSTPVGLTRHAAELEEESKQADAAVAADLTSTANVATPASKH